ncbi:MAG: hypothetical protein VCG02_09385, partial [Verrucomicrobiota bacterium]
MYSKLLLGLLGFSLAASGSERILYEGSGGLSPTASGWALLATPFFGNNVTETVGPGDVVLDTTTTTGDSGGYFSNLISPGIVLDRQQ